MTGSGSKAGATIIECAVALLILAAAFTTATQMCISNIAQQRRFAERQYLRLQAENLMEQAFAVPFDELDEQTIGELVIPDDWQSRLGDVQITAEVTDNEEEMSGKRIHLEIRRTTPQGQLVRPIRLTAYRYAVGEA
jgi:Tfp pilus assembly protein PilV